jgi:hypothetical protein
MKEEKSTKLINILICRQGSFLVLLKNCKKRLSASSCLSVRMEQLGSRWSDFHEIWDLSIFRKAVEKTEFSVPSHKNNGYFK